MGRKPKAAKVVEQVADAMPANTKFSLDKRSPEPKMKTNSAGLSSRKRAKYHSAIIRRSERLLNISTTTRHEEIDPVVDEINLCESEKENDQHVEQNSSESLPGERSLEEKIDYLFQIVEELKSKATRKPFPNGSPCAELNYKRLYIDSQKKIEALTDENHQLGKKLEIAIARYEGFQNGSRVCTKVIEKLKDVILISNLAKATETAFNPSAQSSSGFSSLDAAAEPHAPAVKRGRKRATGNRRS